MNIYKRLSCTKQPAMYLIFTTVFNFHNNHGDDTTIFIILQVRKVRPKEFKSTVQETQ